MSSCGLVMLDNFGGMDLISWFPCIVTFGVTLPFDEVLELSGSSVLSVCNDSFNFVLFFPIDKVRGWSGEVWAVRSCFVVRSQERCVKHIMNSPIWVSPP